jgi:uncharacterized protein
MIVATCPTCGKQFDLQKTDAVPFCNERCRLVDLGRWLSEEQGLPVEPAEEDQEEHSLFPTIPL